MMNQEVAFELTGDHETWVQSAMKKMGRPPTGEEKRQYLRRLIRENRGDCAWSGIPLRLNLASRDSRDGSPCHPVSASLDHADPGADGEGHAIVCYCLNDIKGHLPLKCFRALQQTDAWKSFMTALYDQWQRDPDDYAAIKVTGR